MSKSKSAVEVTINPDQQTFIATADVEVDGKDRTISGSITFMHQKGNGSLTVKIKSGALSFDKETQESVLDAFKEVGRKCYMELLSRRDSWSRKKNGEDEGQTNMFDEDANTPDAAAVTTGQVAVSAD